MLSTFQIRFVVLIVVLSYIVDNSLSDSPGSEIQCKWNCFVHMADLTALMREMVNSSTMNNKLIKLSVQYEKLIDDKCANEKSVNSSEFSSEHCQVCLVNKRLFPSMTSNKSQMNPSLHKEHREIRAICILKPTRITVSSRMDYSSRSSTICHLINFEAGFESIAYYAMETDPLGLCMNFTIPDRTNSTKGLQGALDPRRWPKMVLDVFLVVFFGVFQYYSLAFLCLFYPTEILQDGVTHIILEGASPVSLRSFAGNCFFSRKEGIWYKAKTFILRVFIIPLPFLVTATFFADFELYDPLTTLSYNTVFIVSGFCYCCQAFYISFYSKRSLKVKPCFLCKFFKPVILSCHDEIPRLIKNHLRLQPLILVECWRFYKRCFLNYFKMSATVVPSCRCSRVFVIRLVLFISLLLCIPVVAVALLIVVSLLTFIGIHFTTPATTLCMDHFDRPNRPSTKEVPILLFIFSCLPRAVLGNVTWYGVYNLLRLAGYGALNALLRVLQLSFWEEHFPYVPCSIFVLYYIWSSYSSFTKTYHELALTLYDCYKGSKRTQSQDFPFTSDQMPKLPNNSHDLDNVIAIPKELFEMAREELSPLREGVSILILKITMIVSFVLIVFSLAMVSSFDTTPLVKTLLTFFTLSLSKIVAIYSDGGWQKKLRAKVMEEKVPKIVEKFISETSMTTRGLRDRNANSDEVILINEDWVELAIM